MNLSTVKTIVRRDLHDEDSQNYRWTDEEIERHITHAVRDYSLASPREEKALLATTPGSRELDISSLTDMVVVTAAEYPVGRYPPQYRRFSLWNDTLTLHTDEMPDGSDAAVYYGNAHTLDAVSSTIPAAFEDIIALGACGYAAVEWAVYAVNRVNIGGMTTSTEIMDWGRSMLSQFRKELWKLDRRNRVRLVRMYRPADPPVSQSTDFGP